MYMHRNLHTIYIKQIYSHHGGAGGGGGTESSLPVAQPEYQALSDSLFRLGLIANALSQCSS